MRHTKDSVRKQDRKFNAAFPKPAVPVPVERIPTDAEIDAMVWIGKTSRNLMKRDAAKKRAQRAKSSRKIV